MKTAVSIPDDIFEKADKLAAELSMSRSAFYAKALRESIKRIEDRAISAQIDAALKETPQKPDPVIREAARRRFKPKHGQW